METFRCLLEAGANMYRQYGGLEPPLTIAARRGHLDILQCIIDFGARVHGRDQSFLTPLCAAAGNGHLEIVRCLLPKIDSASSSNLNIIFALESAFRRAALRGHLTVTKLLYEHFAQ